MSYHDTHNLLAKEQFGFRRGISTEDAAISLCKTVAEGIDKKEKCLAIFLDLAKAFDTVSIPILLSKMERLGVRGICLRLFSDLLSNRTQRVKIGDLLSSEAPIAYGVSQGPFLALVSS